MLDYLLRVFLGLVYLVGLDKATLFTKCHEVP